MSNAPKNNSSHTCPLCCNKSIPFYKDIFHLCGNCYGIFRSTKFLPNPAREKERYKQHNNNINDPQYQKFVSPIVNAVIKYFPIDSFGLDYGSGTGPVVSKLLQDRGYDIKQFDPIFYNDKKNLSLNYDYIVCCEVIEHFHSPIKEFHLLKKLLKPRSCLFAMTNIYNSEINFDKWYYKNDITHAFIYQKETFDYIKNNFNFPELIIQDRLIILINE